MSILMIGQNMLEGFEVGELAYIHIDKPVNCICLYHQCDVNNDYNIIDVYTDRLVIKLEECSKYFYNHSTFLIKVLFMIMEISMK